MINNHDGVKESDTSHILFGCFMNLNCVCVWQVKVDLVGLAQSCCPELDLKAELERSFLSEPSSPGHTKAPKGFRLGKHKHETFITSRFTLF